MPNKVNLFKCLVFFFGKYHVLEGIQEPGKYHVLEDIQVQLLSLRNMLSIESYKQQAEVLVRNHVLAAPYILYTSFLCGVLTCKWVYDLTHLISTFCFQSYNDLSKTKRTEWNNRGVSTLHSVFISTISLYFVFWSELFSDHNPAGVITFRTSFLSTFALGMSVGYFLADLGMICWLYPSLGGVEYIVHHSLSAIGVAYPMLTGEGQLYTFMALITEATTPLINMRWYLDMSGLKRSNAYLINGFMILFGWLMARIILLVYMFHHVYLHHSQVMQMHTIGCVLVIFLPLAFATMNVLWFWKILKGLKKTLTKRK